MEDKSRLPSFLGWGLGWRGQLRSTYCTALSNAKLGHKEKSEMKTNKTKTKKKECPPKKKQKIGKIKKKETKN